MSPQERAEGFHLQQSLLLSSVIIGGVPPWGPIQLGHSVPSMNQAVSAKQLAGAVPRGTDEVGAQGHTPSLRAVA